MNYKETLDYLLKKLPMFQQQGAPALKKGLQNITQLCQILGQPHQKFPSIHVAGTNGKGSSSHLLAAALQVQGYKVGLYTSPHLKSFTERIRINGQEIPQQDVVAFVEKYKKNIEAISPSFFEVTVAMAFDFFAQQKVDIAVIEVGMGGRWDSTNIILPKISLITNISFDHQQFLGDTLPKIASEKAGIIKANTPVVISEKHSETQIVFEQKAQQKNAPIYFAQDIYSIQETEKGVFDVFRKGELFLSQLQSQLKGNYQSKNFLGVLATLELLNPPISPENIRKAFGQVLTLTSLKGRWQKIQDSPLIICDTAHNEAGIQEISQQISQINYEKLYFVLGMTGDKDISKMLSYLPKNAHYFFCEAKLPRAMKAQDLALAAQKYGLLGQVVPDVNQALAAAQAKAQSKDFIFVGGSSFVVAELEQL